jgi:hypothetical protein
MKNIFACVKVQNEADIIESLCRYYCSFCDGILVVDNMSSDNTLDILKSLVNEGLPVFAVDVVDMENLSGKGLSPRQQQFDFLLDRHGADIILPIDADEFLISVNGGNPRPVLESLDETVEYHLRRRNYICPKEVKNNELFFPCTTNKYAELTSPKTIMSRFLFKKKNAYPAPACHSFCYDKDPPDIIDSKILCYNHYPIRNIHQFMLKSILGWAHYLTRPYHDGDRRGGEAWHWKAFYDEIKKNGTVTQEQVERYSAYSSTSLPADNNYVLMENPFDTSFCQDKLKLRYTDYGTTKKYFLQVLTTQLETNLRNMPSWRSATERKAAGEQLGQANAVIHNLNSYIETLHNKAPVLTRSGRFYFDTGKNFNEGEAVHFNHSKEDNHFNYEILLPSDTKAIRFDPVEGYGCFVKDLVIKTDTGNLIDCQILNGFKSENNGIVFTTTDPQILIFADECKIKKIEVQCDIWFFY